MPDPLYAVDLARRLGIARVVVPSMAAVLSALGMVIAPAAYTAVRSLVAAIETLTPRELVAAMQALEAVARDAVASGDIARASSVRIARLVELRYRGHGRSLRVPAGAIASRHDMDALTDEFHERYARRFGVAQRDQAVQITAIRVTATFPAPVAPALSREAPKAKCPTRGRPAVRA